MKRLMPASLISFLANNRNFLKADLFTILLPTGQIICATEGAWDITVPAGVPGWSGPTTTFYSIQYGKWSRGNITSEASHNLSANTMALTLVPQVGTAYPGTALGMLYAAMNGLFDAAQVYVYTVYMPIGHYGTVYTPGQGVFGSGQPTTPAQGGVETKFFGTITKVVDITRLQVEFECADPFYVLNIKVPTRLLQANCPWSFGDSNCAPPGGIAAYTTNFTAAGTSTQWVLNPTVTTGNFAIADYFTQGVVKCLTGNNAGLSQSIKKHLAAAPYLSVVNKWLMPIQAGDTFSVIAGCDKTLGTCAQKFNNNVHFGGMPFIPVPTTAI